MPSTMTVGWTWTPSTDKLVNFVEVKDFIEGLSKRFNASLITFDRWNSVSMIEHFEGLGYESQVLSVGINHYHDLKMLVLDERVRIPYSEILIRELKELRIMPNGKLDHPRTGCFVGDTRIPLLDGTMPTIAELEGKENWVYSCTPEGHIVPGKSRGRITKYTDELVDIVLDNGYIARCTPDHKWMLRNGEYKQAQEFEAR